MTTDPKWQRELDLDRQRAESGHSIENPNAASHRGTALDADVAEYYSAGMAMGQPVGGPQQPYQQPPQQQATPPEQRYPSSGGAAPMADAAPTGTPPAWAQQQLQGSGGSAAPPQEYRFVPHAYPSDVDEFDPRFAIRFVPLPPALVPKFGSKIGRLLYMTHAVSGYFKGTFSPAKTPMQLFVTPRCVWLGEPKSGKLVMCRDVLAIRTLFLLGDSGVGIRSAKGPDVFFKDLPGPERERLAVIVTRLRDQASVITDEPEGGAAGAVIGAAMPLSSSMGVNTFRVERGSEKAEAAYRKDINYVDEKEWDYPLVEDPRTGLRLVPVPERNREHYAPLVPKNMHYFGGVHQVALNAKGATTGTRRGCWVTPTCVFLSVHTGPQRDGRDIVRCIPIEDLTLVINGPGFALGLRAESKPPQPDCIIDFDDLVAKKVVLFALERCYRFRTNRLLVVRDAPHFDALRLADERSHKPTLHAMKTVADLYNLLRSSTA